MTAPLVIMVGADKGGTGKTTLCRVVADYLDAMGVNYRPLDTEYPAGGLVRFMRDRPERGLPAAEIIDIRSIEGQMKAFDSMAGITLIDVRAGELTQILDLLDRAQMLEQVKSGEIRLALMHVLGPSVQSLGEVAHASMTVRGQARHFLVKNRVSESAAFFEWEGPDSPYAQVLGKMAAVTISVPHLVNRIAEETDSKSLSFRQFAQDGAGSRTLKGYTRTWLENIWAEFERVGLCAMIREAANI